jgi:hypothetical protein
MTFVLKEGRLVNFSFRTRGPDMKPLESLELGLSLPPELHPYILPQGLFVDLTYGRFG